MKMRKIKDYYSQFFEKTSGKFRQFHMGERAVFYFIHTAGGKTWGKRKWPNGQNATKAQKAKKSETEFSARTRKTNKGRQAKKSEKFPLQILVCSVLRYFALENEPG